VHAQGSEILGRPGQKRKEVDSPGVQKFRNKDLTQRTQREHRGHREERSSSRLLQGRKTFRLVPGIRDIPPLKRESPDLVGAHFFTKSILPD